MTPSSLICSPSILLLTGNTYGGSLDSVEIVTLNMTCPEKLLPNSGIYDFGHSLDYVDGHIYLCGAGFSGGGDVCWEMLIDNTWVELPSRLFTKRDRQAHSVVRSKLFQIGGSKSDQIFTQVLDLKESEEWNLGFLLKESTNMGCAVTLSDERVAVLGSTRWDSLIPLFDGVNIYDVEDGTSVQLKHLAIGRKAMGCTSYVKNGKEYILTAGGFELETSCFFDLCSK